MPIDYPQVLHDFPWITQRNLNCVLSPDSDGFLCGLLLTHALGWSVKGFYDGKILLLERGCDMTDCVFLDMDVNRSVIRSVGHHIVLYNKRLLPGLNDTGHFDYSACIQPNMLRGFDGKNDFQRKYPFGTVHFLLGILQRSPGIALNLPPDAVWPLLFTDGVWNNVFGYTENCLEWLDWLRVTDEQHILHSIFCASGHSFYDIMQGLNSFLRMRDQYNATGTYRGYFMSGGRNKRTGDKLRISDTAGDPINLVPGPTDETVDVHETERDRIVGFISEMSQRIGWPYRPDRWTWDGLSVTRFRKADFSKSRLNNVTYMEMISRNPFSMAMTSGTNIEYTY